MTTQTKTNEFLNPARLLAAIPVEPNMQVADFGCGNGYYAVAAAGMVGKKGQVYALDILEDALSQVATAAKLVGVQNVSTRECDLEKFGSCDLPDTSCDIVIMASILHQAKERENIFREVYRVLKSSGRLLVVEWKPDSILGPDRSVRVSQKEVKTLLEKFSFRPAGELPAGSFHYALLYQK